MTAEKSADHPWQLQPVRVAPHFGGTSYIIHEHEINIVEAGSPATLAFNFAVALISIGISFVLTLTTTTIASNRLFYGYLNACLVCLLAGIIMFAYWLRTRTSVNVTVAKIKGRLVVPTPVREPPPADPAGS